jgi:hypothetical protein
MPTHTTKRPNTGANGYAGERGAAPPPEHLPVPAASAPPAFPGEAAFRRIPAPLEWAGHRALFDGGTISSKKGVLPVPGPPNGFYFRFPTRKNDGPNRTSHGTRPQDGRRYAVPPSPTGQGPKSPAFQALNVRPPPLVSVACGLRPAGARSDRARFITRTKSLAWQWQPRWHRRTQVSVGTRPQGRGPPAGPISPGVCR